jgi:hypothetical protein
MFRAVKHVVVVGAKKSRAEHALSAFASHFSSSSSSQRFALDLALFSLS